MIRLHVSPEWASAWADENRALFEVMLDPTPDNTRRAEQAALKRAGIEAGDTQADQAERCRLDQAAARLAARIAQIEQEFA